MDREIRTLFPIDYDANLLPQYLRRMFGVLGRKLRKIDSPRFSGRHDKEGYRDLIDKFSILPETVADPIAGMEGLVSELFSGVPRWRSPKLQHNVGAPVNSLAVAMYALALDENVYAINNGLAGNALVAEQAVARMLANLASIEIPAAGLFTFGGTATNFYATRLGIMKAAPDSGRTGVPRNLKVIVTEDSHFSHTISAEWLGIGTDNVAVVSSDVNRRSDLRDAELKMRRIFDDGELLGSIIVNGGTTYGQVVDDISGFVRLRDQLVDEYDLSYVPHLHVDSVIGWAWLMFKDYDWDINPLEIPNSTLAVIREQFNRVAALKYADSWGVDFHKGVGGCPVDSSIVMFNDATDLNYLSKKKGAVVEMHQLATDFSFDSPADFTLETSRAGGAALSALAALHSMGANGYRRNLALLVDLSLYTRELLFEEQDVVVCHPESSLGYVTMLRLYPPEFIDEGRMGLELMDGEGLGDFVDRVNSYMKQFFVWDSENRMVDRESLEYSFSSGYVNIGGRNLSGIKLYPVSPLMTRRDVDETVGILMSQKRKFDAEVWNK